MNLSEPVFWLPSCQPVRVQWDAPRTGEPGALWQLSLNCEGCGRWRQLEVLSVLAEDVGMAEKCEQIALASLHAPPEPDLSDIGPYVC